jgi:hypothetical protein
VILEGGEPVQAYRVSLEQSLSLLSAKMKISQFANIKETILPQVRNQPIKESTEKPKLLKRRPVSRQNADGEMTMRVTNKTSIMVY